MTDAPAHKPVSGKSIFQIDVNMKVRFNSDGWVEEIGKGGEDEPLGTRLHGGEVGGYDDVYARRFYDLCSRVVIFDLHPKRISDQGIAAGLLQFRDLDPDSHLYKRLQKIIEIANTNFAMGIKPLN